VVRLLVQQLQRDYHQLFLTQALLLLVQEQSVMQVVVRMVLLRVRVFVLVEDLEELQLQAHKLPLLVVVVLLQVAVVQ
jgi:hypothetical protein